MGGTLTLYRFLKLLKKELRSWNITCIRVINNAKLVKYNFQFLWLNRKLTLFSELIFRNGNNINKNNNRIVW